MTWPKQLPILTSEQQRIGDDFMHYWHVVLPKKFGIVETFNHSWPVKHSGRFITTLEIGAGLGEHLNYECLTPEQEKNYWAMDIRENMVEGLKDRFPMINSFVGDCQKRLNFPPTYFDRILAIHVLEHLPDLPKCIEEMRRLIRPKGKLLAVIPCEGGLVYTSARKISAERIYKKRYKDTAYPSYEWFYTREHINLPHEIFTELEKHFSIRAASFFPLLLPMTWMNLCIGLELVPNTVS